ncbi:hypothetical protein ASE08_25615 [Rhizobacter sp. Root16D2]|nr:hypothetical protein ASE08_25615 [Rhizobacter sp. Root16D2]
MATLGTARATSPGCKAMPDAHLVEHLHVEVGFGGGLEVPEAEARLAAFVQGPALRIIDALFDAACGPDEVWRIDELAIDLGEVALDGLEETWAERLRERLQERLADLRGPGGAAAARTGPGGVRRSLPQARLEALLHFLRHGHLPWQGRGEDPATLAAEVLRHGAAALADALRAMDDRPRLLRRLVTQFDAGWLGALVHALMPGEPAAADRLLKAAALGTAALWEAVLGQALAHAAAPQATGRALLRAQLLAALEADSAYSASSDPLQSVASAWAPLLRDDRDWLKATLQRLGDRASLRQRIVRALPAALLHQVLGLWLGSGVTAAVDDWIAAVASGGPASADERAERRQLLWQATLQHAWQRGAAPFDAWRYVDHVRSQVAAASVPALPPSWFERVVRAATSVLASAVAALGFGRRAAVEPPHEPVAGAVREPEVDAPPPPVELLPVGNAGLVLAAPYLPRLFMMLGLSDERAFAGPEAAERAALLLQLVATGEAAAPEPALVLNKLLCGIDLAAPVMRALQPTDAERSAVDGLLAAMILHWKVLGSTSVAGLRETFLQRDGRLQHADEHWQLHVAPRPFDMLIDQLPWGYATVRHPWMKEVLHVEWR